MRAVIWNVWWRFGGAWREREPGIVTTLARVRPGLVGLVETWTGDGTTQPDHLAAQLGMAAAASVPTSLPPPPGQPEEPSQAGIEMGLGLLSRWPIREVEAYELPHTQRSGAAPTALLASVAHPAGRLPVIVACTEWEPHYAADHLAQCRALAALAAAPRLDGDLPVMLLADLNAAAGQPELAPLLEVMVDTWAAGGGDPAAVTLSSALPEAPLAATKQIDRRIDHVLARPGRAGGTITVSRAFLAGDRPLHGRFPSDHFAVVVDLAW